MAAARLGATIGSTRRRKKETQRQGRKAAKGEKQQQERGDEEGAELAAETGRSARGRRGEAKRRAKRKSSRSKRAGGAAATDSPPQPSLLYLTDRQGELEPPPEALASEVWADTEESVDAPGSGASLLLLENREAETGDTAAHPAAGAQLTEERAAADDALWLEPASPARVTPPRRRASSRNRGERRRRRTRDQKPAVRSEPTAEAEAVAVDQRSSAGSGGRDGGEEDLAAAAATEEPGMPVKKTASPNRTKKSRSGGTPERSMSPGRAKAYAKARKARERKARAATAGSRPELFGELNSGYKMVTGVTFDDDGESDDEDRDGEYGYEYEYEYEAADKGP
eukprot:COSAG01_NODE_8063_length_2934_cov_4.053968_2_plen_340_part_00